MEFRYGTQEMKAIWEEDFRLRCLFRVEAALAQAEEELGMIPPGGGRGDRSGGRGYPAPEGQGDRG